MALGVTALDKFSSNFKQSIALRGLPRLDRFFPSCGLGVVELTARARFDVTDIKPCWFASGFEYRRPDELLSLAPREGGELPVHLGVGGGPGRRAWQLLENLYGISVEKQTLATFDAFARWITDSLERDMPALVLMDQSFLPGRARWEGAYSPHMVAVTGVDSHRRSLLITEQVLGRIEWMADDVVSSFERVSDNAENFALGCRKTGPTVSSLVGPRDIIGHLDGCLRNRQSTEPLIGLNGLRLFASDLMHVYETFQGSFSIPGMWIFSHDRHAFRRTLMYWRQALPSQRAMLNQLDAHLGLCFEEWFAVDMCVESSVRSGAAKMAEGVDRVARIVELEETLTVILQELRMELQTL